MSNQQYDRVIALAAMVQSLTLVQQIAETGQLDQDDFETLLNSLLATDAPTAEAIYGDCRQLKTGLKQLNRLLSKSKDKQDVALLRHAVNLLHLEKQLAKRPAMFDLLFLPLESG